jgi:UDP-N-acetyl-D-galactosamine dehydrogenase
VLVMGLTFKENVPDLRNSRVIDVIERLKELGHEVAVHDALANPAEAEHEYGVALSADALEQSYDVVLVAVPHAAYGALGDAQVTGMIAEGGLLADLKNLYGGRQLLGPFERWTL